MPLPSIDTEIHRQNVLGSVLFAKYLRKFAQPLTKWTQTQKNSSIRFQGITFSKHQVTDESRTVSGVREPEHKSNEIITYLHMRSQFACVERARSQRHSPISN